MGEEEIVVRSSAGQFQEFLESTVWGDLENELTEWLDGARDGLEDADAGEKDLYRNQGRAEAIRRMMTLPEVMRDSLIEAQRDNHEEEQNLIDMEEITNE